MPINMISASMDTYSMRLEDLLAYWLNKWSIRSISLVEALLEAEPKTKITQKSKQSNIQSFGDKTKFVITKNMPKLLILIDFPVFNSDYPIIRSSPQYPSKANPILN